MLAAWGRKENTGCKSRPTHHIAMQEDALPSPQKKEKAFWGEEEEEEGPKMTRKGGGIKLGGA